MVFFKKGFEVMSGLVGSKCLSSIFVLGYWMNVSRALGGYGCRESVGEFVVDVPCGPSHCGAHHRVRGDIGAPYALDPFFLSAC